jgi:hypothetical protein
VQVSVAAHDGIKAKTYVDLIPVNGHLRISSIPDAHYYQKVRFRISMTPNWSGYVSCTKQVTKNNWDYYTHFRLHLTNGVGAFSTVAGTDKVTNIGLSCSAETNNLNDVLGGSAVTIF